MSLRSLGPQPTKMCPVSVAWCRLGVPHSRFCPDSGGWCGFVLGCLLPSLLPGWPGSWSRFKSAERAFLGEVPGMGAFVRAGVGVQPHPGLLYGGAPFCAFRFFRVAVS